MTGEMFSTLVQAFFLGVQDSVNPCALVAVLIFVAVISHVCYRRIQIILFGIFFSLSIFFATLLSNLGFFDKLSMVPLIGSISRVIYMGIALGFIILGAIHFLDWVRYKKSRDRSCFYIKGPIFSRRSPEESKKLSALGVLAVIGSSVVLGVFIRLLGELWPYNYYLFVQFFSLIGQGAKVLAFGSFFIYAMAYILPLVTLWVMILVFTASERMRMELYRAVAYVKMVFSAVFFATGFGMGYLIVKNLI